MSKVIMRLRRHETNSEAIITQEVAEITLLLQENPNKGFEVQDDWISANIGSQQEVAAAWAHRLIDRGFLLYEKDHEFFDRRLIRINSKAELLEVERLLGVRPDWHEPDEQQVEAKFFGEDFDNAGYWGLDHKITPRYQGEMFVVLHKKGEPIAEINLAVLFAIACGGIE